MNCPGSIVLCDGLPEKSSPYAEEGTRAHALAEAVLTGKPAQAESKEMAEHVRVYTDHVVELACANRENVLHVEVQVRATPEVWGTADAIVWEPSTATLYVRDLKYGAGVPVEVSDNLQLKIYALAALLTMKYPARLVNVGIVQPRINHPDGHCRSKDFDAIDLIEFFADLKDAVRDVELAKIAPPDHFEDFVIPTEKGCRWCLASFKCPKLKTLANDMAKRVFAPGLPYDPAELAETLDSLDLIEGWAKNVREFAYGEAEKGNPIPHYKLVEKRPTRKWKADITEALAKALGLKAVDLYGEAPMKSVTDIQKLCPGKNDKERAAVLDPFVTKESSGHSLVHESDKRDAVRIDAKSVFSE